MAVERVKCTECDAMILPQTAASNDGLCARCFKTPRWLRDERREYERQLAAGLLFRPSEQALAEARQPSAIVAGVTVWRLEPEFYAGSPLTAVRDALAQAQAEDEGNVFLVASDTVRLNLAFNQRYGVCTHENAEDGDYVYACTEDNLTEQVPNEHHLVQSCPCCGVGLHWFPSRFHMPRERAFEIFQSVASNLPPAGVIWLEQGDTTYTAPGRG